MKQTTNYQLNQWEAQDRILREDFNADNFKIEQALGAMQEEIEAARAANPYVKLLDVTNTEDRIQWDIDVSHIDFTQYWQIYLYFDPRVTTSQYFLRFNGLNANYEVQTHTGQATNSNSSAQVGAVYQDSLIMFHPVTDGNITVTMQSIYPSRGFIDCKAPLTWGELTQLNFSSAYATQPMLAGSRVSMFGLRR